MPTRIIIKSLSGENLSIPPPVNKILGNGETVVLVGMDVNAFASEPHIAKLIAQSWITVAYEEDKDFRFSTGVLGPNLLLRVGNERGPVGYLRLGGQYRLEFTLDLYSNSVQDTIITIGGVPVEEFSQLTAYGTPTHLEITVPAGVALGLNNLSVSVAGQQLGFATVIVQPAVGLFPQF